MSEAMLEPTATTDKQPKKPVVKNKEKKVQNLRFFVQVAFVLLCVWIGVEFFFFTRYLESGGTTALVQRPPGAEGFLPISSLMSLYYWLVSGEIHPYHPAGLFILVAIIAVSWVFGKAFCSWICPVGFISEMLGDLTKKVFGKNLTVPRWLDYPLRSLKYLLLGFFVWAIFFAMSTAALKAFLDSPYNLVSDVKMYYFFADISQFALITILALVGLSLVVRGFWCRYLCPYGALLGVVSLLSFQKIKRNAESCIDCGKCAKVCPASIKVDQVRTVVSDECTSCLACVDSCPVAKTLQVQTAVTKHTIRPRYIAIGVVGIFVAITGLAMLTGHWHNKIAPEQYMQLQPDINMLGHPTGAEDINDLNRSATEPADAQTAP